MGFTEGTGPEGTPGFNNTPQTTADLLRLRDLVVQRGNTRKGTRAERDSLPAAELADGLIWQDTDDGLTFKRLSGAWVTIGGGLVCRYLVSGQLTGVAGSKTLTWTTSPAIDIGGFQDTNQRFVLPVSGLYRITIAVYTTGVVARQLMLSVNGGSAIRLNAAIGGPSAPADVVGTLVDLYAAGTTLTFSVLDAAAGLLVLGTSWISIELIR